MATNSPVKYESSYKSKDLGTAKFTHFFDNGTSYESSYKSKDLGTAKFTHFFDNGTSFKETCDKYNSMEESILEVMHYTTKRYNKRVAEKMQWTWREKFDDCNEEILDNNVHIYWTT